MDTSDKNKSENDVGPTAFQALCAEVIALETPYEDVAERIEDLAYLEYDSGGLDDVVGQLERVAHAFESLRNKNEEVSRDLAQVYLLIGQIYQFTGMFNESIEWLNKSIVVDDMYPVSYHSLAVSYQGIGDTALAARSLEQEVTVAPGNYYTYLLLADIYEKNGMDSEFEGVLKRLLERDPDNIQGLHKLIRHYERYSAQADVELLRRRLLGRAEGLSRIEAVIRAYHLCRAGRCGDALGFLAKWSGCAPDVSITHLVNAHIYGLTHQYSKKRSELSLFKRKNHGRDDVMEIKMREFASVFGEEAAEKLRQRLRVAYMMSA
jgi:tetratricopeptide (TPR) repeat protein